jgi:hypothetical protein
LTFALTCGGGFYAPNLTTLGTAPVGSSQSFLGGGLGAADVVTKSGYVVQLEADPYAGAPGSCNNLAPSLAGRGYRAAADPADATNFRFFGVNSQGMIFEHTASLFASMPEVDDPPVGHTLR